MLHVHKDRLDTLNSIDIGNEFVENLVHWQQVFGTFDMD